MRGTVRGESVFETTGTPDKNAAEALRIKREGTILKRSVFGAESTITFPEAVDAYLENGGEGRFLGGYDPETKEWFGLVGHFKDAALASIGQEEADAAANKLYPGCKASTKLRCCYVPLRAVLKFSAKRRWCPLAVIEAPAVGKVVTKFSTPERLLKLLPHCKPRLRLFVMVDTYTGARLSEILRIDWDKDVMLERRTIMLWTTKEKQRAVYIPDPLMVALEAVPEAQRKGKMFDNWSHKSRVHRPLKNACKRAGVEYLPPHQQGRHTYATWLREYAKLDLRALMEAGGWSSISSVVRYLHVTPGDAAREADKMPSMSLVPPEPVQNPCIDNGKRKKSPKTKARSN
ncbi:MAG TPA: site-specific integrase [Rhizomicrobium sp.]|jgi:integrase